MEDLLSILEILSPISYQTSRLKSFVSNLPDVGFPLKIGMNPRAFARPSHTPCCVPSLYPPPRARTARKHDGGGGGKEQWQEREQTQHVTVRAVCSQRPFFAEIPLFFSIYATAEFKNYKECMSCAPMHQDLQQGINIFFCSPPVKPREDEDALSFEIPLDFTEIAVPWTGGEMREMFKATESDPKLNNYSSKHPDAQDVISGLDGVMLNNDVDEFGEENDE